jgi:hypothetical protein
VQVACSSRKEAAETIERMICEGKLQTTEVSWGEPVYEDDTFEVYDDQQIFDEED